MENCLSYIDLDWVVEKRNKEFLGQLENFKDAMGCK